MKSLTELSDRELLDRLQLIQAALSPYYYSMPEDERNKNQPMVDDLLIKQREVYAEAHRRLGINNN
jgi:hypothetical protein